MKNTTLKTKINAGLLIIISTLSLNLVKVAWGASQKQQQSVNELSEIIRSTLIASFNHGNQVIDVKFNPLGDRILTIGNENQKLWSIDGEELSLKDGSLLAAGFTSRENQTILTKFIDSEKTLKFFNLQGRELFTLENLPVYITSTNFSSSFPSISYDVNLPQQRFAVIDGDGTVKIMKFNGFSRYTLRHNRSKIENFAFHPQGNLIATISSDGTTKLWNTSDGREILSIDDPDLSSPNLLSRIQYDKQRIKFSSTGDLFVIWNSSGKAQIFNSDGEAVGTLKHDGGVGTLLDLQFSPQKNIVATSGNGKLKIWQVNGEKIHEFEYVKHKTPNLTILRGIRFNPDGNLVTFNGTASIFHQDEARLWNAIDGEEIDLSQFKEQDSFIRKIVFSPDGKAIATIGEKNIVKLWLIQ